MNHHTFTRICEGDGSNLAGVEWLLTNGIGSFAMGTALGSMSRRYHGLLVASLRPPVKRVMMLNNLAETLIVEPGSSHERRTSLSKHCFRPGELHPAGESSLQRFEKDATVRWEHHVSCANGSQVVVRRHLAMVRGSNTIVMRYTLHGSGQRVRMMIRPLVSMRDFHALILRDTAGDWFRVEHRSDRFAVQSPMGSVHLAIAGGDGPSAQRDEQWWFNFQYNHERDRGYDYLEDMFSPGEFVVDAVATAAGVSFTVVASTDSVTPAMLALDPAAIRREQLQRLESHAAKLPAAARGAPWAGDLVSAADDFVVKRQAPGSPAGSPLDRVSVIAGYPWFADWGRDSMIALPGLLLATGRLEEARAVLRTFAGACKGGLVPNVFDDYTGEAHYNTVDASLWFLHACCEYVNAGGDARVFEAEMLPACREVVSHYVAGTEGNIRMDPADGLISAGNERTQLTWMDAKRDGVVFTPRFGKAVEVNALWHHGLRSLEKACDKIDVVFARRCADLASLAASGIKGRFWNANAGCLFDCLQSANGSWQPQGEIRPNQLLAVSLRHTALDHAQRRAVTDTCRNLLCTPLGVRTLDPHDGRYRGRFRGRIFDRDAAYHNGTAWPWLLGPMCEATLRAGAFSPSACDAAASLLAPAIAYIDGPCPGQLPEVVDGDSSEREPQQPGGCPAQAWSIAEVLRVAVLIERARKGEKNL